MQETLVLEVSNPWREAIEERRPRGTKKWGKLFPILGGRLLKIGLVAIMEDL